MNLSNIAAAPVRWPNPCTHCEAIVPSHQNCNVTGGKKTAFDREDVFPAFPGLLASLEAGCLLCRVIFDLVTGENISRQIQYSVKLFCLQDRIASHEPVRLKIDFFFAMHNQLHYPIDDGLFGLDPFQENIDDAYAGHSCFTCGLPREQFCRLTNMRLSVRFINLQEPCINASVEVCVFDSADLESPFFERRTRIPSPSVLSPEHVDMMKRWIHDCVQGHLQCADHSEPWIPTRLLEVRPVANAVGFSVRLVTTSSAKLPLSTQYASLSHMWGDNTVAPPLRTLKENVQNFYREIEPKRLPRNFADAAQVCLHLSIRYLWIDSLCIIQDSEKDWYREAGMMHKVYNKAIVTLVATSATSSHDGFLIRDLTRFPAVKVAYPVPETGSTPKPKQDSQKWFRKWSVKKKPASGKAESQLEIQPRGKYMIICYPEFSHYPWTTSIERAKWNTRGWTFQERQLSTRLIHFCHDRTIFECRSCAIIEDSGMESAGLDRDSEWKIIGVAEQYRRWVRFLEEFNRRDLTKQSDRLQALRGVAEAMAPGLSMEYLVFAGMWRQNLHNEILWHPNRMHIDFGDDDLEVKATRHVIQRRGRAGSPSWAWATIDGPLYFDQRAFAPPSAPRFDFNSRFGPFEILSCHPPPVGATPVPGVYGFLEVRGLTKCITDYEGFEFPAPWDRDVLLKGDSGGHSPSAFATGVLDVEPTNKSIPLNRTSSYIYLHVNDEGTGLLLERVVLAGGYQSETLWKRIGIAYMGMDVKEDQIEVYKQGDRPERILII